MTDKPDPTANFTVHNLTRDKLNQLNEAVTKRVERNKAPLIGCQLAPNVDYRAPSLATMIDDGQSPLKDIDYSGPLYGWSSGFMRAKKTSYDKPPLSDAQVEIGAYILYAAAGLSVLGMTTLILWIIGRMVAH